MRTIRNRRAIVTGAASGIGRAIARALAAEGARLFLIDQDQPGLAEAVDEIGAMGVEVHSAVCDLAVPAQITAANAQIRSHWNLVHIIVNCAGVSCFGAFHLADEMTWRRVMAINLLAPMQIVHEWLGVLLSADEAHILNVCSLFGLVPARKLTAYHASKFGLVGYTLGLRYDYSNENFGVTALCPGFVRTPMLATIRGPEAHLAPAEVPEALVTTPEAVAAAAINAIRRNQGIVTVTAFARAAWWLWRWAPGFADWLLRDGRRWIAHFKVFAPTDPA